MRAEAILPGVVNKKFTGEHSRYSEDVISSLGSYKRLGVGVINLDEMLDRPLHLRYVKARAAANVLLVSVANQRSTWWTWKRGWRTGQFLMAGGFVRAVVSIRDNVGL